MVQIVKKGSHLTTPDVLRPISFPETLTSQESTNAPQMTPFWKVDIPGYLVRGMKIVIVIAYFSHMECAYHK
ncbi:hypothetical protein AB205_0162080 [Aquarana catesbeiana]|uniref:Uncharacterized protein n=1 Tax=Aquarana catesbeiana TaxID=8400 RepID=A0A2G9Q8J8_AQUCT|nr:hypothetical protein AB205_0162080 [Aquarana catesbeiana]